MKRLLVAVGILVAFVIGAPAVSGAGGWVVVSLDTAPDLRSGDTVDIGFTVLRHGVTPESNEDLEIVLTDSSGKSHRFAATPQGAVGHHVAKIDAPTAGAYTWRVVGEVVDADLGRISVLDSSSGSGTSWTWDAAQWGSLALALAMAGLTGRDVLHARRNRAAAPVAA